MFKKNKTVSLDVSLISPAVGGKRRNKELFGSGNLSNLKEFDSPKRYGSQGKLRKISGTRSPMRLDLISGSNADLRAG